MQLEIWSRKGATIVREPGGYVLLSAGRVHRLQSPMPHTGVWALEIAGSPADAVSVIGINIKQFNELLYRSRVENDTFPTGA